VLSNKVIGVRRDDELQTLDQGEAVKITLGVRAGELERRMSAATKGTTEYWQGEKEVC
jgi:hypothetical protein